MTDEDTKDEKPEGTTENAGDGVQSETSKELDRADEIVERRNRVCEREEAILSRKESFAAREAASGRAEAGQEQLTPEQKVDETAKKEADEIVNAFR